MTDPSTMAIHLNFPRAACLLVLSASLLVACERTTEDVAGPAKPVPVPATPNTSVARLRLFADTNALLPGLITRLYVDAFDGLGVRSDATGAGITVGDASVVSVGNVRAYPIIEATGAKGKFLLVQLAAQYEGTTVVRVELNGIRDSLVIPVHALSNAIPPLVADSFSVVEFGPNCGSGCEERFYAPLLKLREPSGRNAVDVVAVRFTMPGASTGTCRGSVRYAPGSSAHLNGIDPYLYNNDLLFVSLTGARFPDGMANARVYLRDAAGVFTALDVSGPVEHPVPVPTLPPPIGESWQCG